MGKFLCTLLFVIYFNNCTAQIPQEKAISKILTYWFGDLQNEEDYPHMQSKIWFAGGNAVDEEIEKSFGYLVQDAVDHKLDGWKEIPQGRLALIILIDQFSRNIFRGKPEAFAGDVKAQELCLEGLALKVDLQLLPIERVFFYLPLEHAEDLALQRLSVLKFQQLAESVAFPVRSHFNSFTNYAVRHCEIIEKFARFPHRNNVLGRVSTLEEVEFLKGPNSSF